MGKKSGKAKHLIPLSSYHQAPLRAKKVLGRAEDLDALIDHFEKSDHLLLLHGTGGVGKTTLAGYYLEKCSEQYKHMAWVTYTSDFLSDFVNQVNNDEYLGIKRKKQFEDTLVQLFHAMGQLSGPNLLIIDNINTEQQALDVARYRPQFPQGWKILLTSRVKIGIFPAHQVGVLAEGEAVRLFMRHYKLQKNDEPKDLQLLLQQVGLHTLAVEMMAKTLRQLPSWNIRKLYDRLLEKGLTQLDTSVSVATSHSESTRNQKQLQELHQYIRLIFDLSYQAMEEEEQQLLLYLALMPTITHSLKVLRIILGKKEEADFDRLATQVQRMERLGFLEEQMVEEQRSFFMSKVLQEVIIEMNQPLNMKTCGPLLNSIDALLTEYSLPQVYPFLPYADAICRQLQDDLDGLDVILLKLADFNYEIGNYLGIEEDLKRCLKIRRLSNNQWGIAVCLERLGRMYKSLGNYEKSLEYFEERNRLGKELYASNPKSESLKNGLAISYCQIGMIKE